MCVEDETSYRAVDSMSSRFPGLSAEAARVLRRGVPVPLQMYSNTYPTLVYAIASPFLQSSSVESLG